MKFRLATVAILIAGSSARAQRPLGAPPIPVFAPPTFANPLDLDYRFTAELPSRREAADPWMIVFNDNYYLFASRTGGYWWSSDMKQWKGITPTGLPVEFDGPAVVAIGDTVYYTAHKAKAVYATTSPRLGEWSKVADIDSYDDPSFFLDDDGKLYLYYGSALNGSISAVQLDYRDGFKVISGPKELLAANIERHGWERAGPDNLGVSKGATVRLAPFIEGSSVIKHDGYYYLQYAAPGADGKSYSDGVYLSQSPMSDFVYAPYSPFSSKPGGLVGGAGSGMTFRDKRGTYWRVATMSLSVVNPFERRLGIFPAGFDSDGILRTDTYLGDYPQFLPGVVRNPLDKNRAPWMLLSAGKQVTASTTFAGTNAQFAVDGDLHTEWRAESNAFGEWLQIDLGEPMMVAALQINFGEQRGRGDQVFIGDSVVTGDTRYVIHVSPNGKTWNAVVDASHQTLDEPHAYVELPEPTKQRYVRLANARVGGTGAFAISEIRVFGVSNQKAPPEVQDFTVTRDSTTDNSSATITWKKSPRAIGYVIRYGISPKKLYNNYEVGDVSTLTLNSLNAGLAYYFTIDAIGEGGIARGSITRPEP